MSKERTEARAENRTEPQLENTIEHESSGHVSVGSHREGAGLRLKTIRKSKGLTQEQVGVIIGRSKAFVSAVENGSAKLTADMISTLSSSLGVQEEWLACGEGDMTSNEATRDRRSIGERVYQVRREHRLSQSQFAAIIGVSRNTISLLERRKVNPSPALIRSVVEKFQVDEAWLRTGESTDLTFLDDPRMRRSVIAYLRQRYPDELWANTSEELDNHTH